MKVAFGLKAHSGWSVLVVIGAARGESQHDIAALGKTAGPPWGKDQKSATLAAMVALQGRPG